MPSLRPRTAPAVLTAALAALAGCDGNSNPVDPDPGPGTGTLECEIQRYPCSLSEVDLAILVRSNALGDSALARLDSGMSTADAAAWLAGQAGMAEVMSDGLGIRFRLDGGRGTWVVTEGATLTEPRPSASASEPASPSRTAFAPPGPVFDIVASGSAQKRALVLSPGLWEFGQWDSGPAVRNILASTRGYENGVTFAANGVRLSTEVGLASFMGWDAYDVVHVTSHGARVCDNSLCRGVLAVNVLEAFFPATLSEAELIEKLKEVNQRGVELLKGGEQTYIAINADFFRAHASGLEDTIIFFNSCQLFGGPETDLVAALAGTSNVFFGWTEAVYADEALEAATRLFEELSVGGYPAAIAHERLGGLGTGSPTPFGPSPVLRMAPRPAGGDLQIREVVTLLHPGSGEELKAGDRVQIEGIQGDGQHDSAPFRVQIDGVLAEHASDMLLVVSVDGVATAPLPVSSGTANENDQWIVEGTIPLGYDLEEDRPVTFLARVGLASEGESEHESEATLSGGSWTLVSEGQGTSSVSVHGADAQATYAWTADAQFTVDGEGRVLGEGVGFLSGTEITVSYDDEELFCLVSGPFELEFDFDLVGQIEQGVLDLETANLEAAQFSATSCDEVGDAEIAASLLAVMAAMLETTVPFQHEAERKRELPVSGPLMHAGVVVGSFELFYAWTNIIRNDGCPVGAEDEPC